MAAGTTSQDTKRKEGVLQAYPVLASEIVYSGRPLLLKSSGRLAFSNDGVTNTIAAGDRFAGINTDTCDNSTGLAGAFKARAYRKGCFLMKFSDTLTQGNVGDKVYVNNVSDDAVVTVTSDTGNVQVTIGVITEFVSANLAYVQIDNYVDGVAATA